MSKGTVSIRLLIGATTWSDGNDYQSWNSCLVEWKLAELKYSISDWSDSQAVDIIRHIGSHEPWITAADQEKGFRKHNPLTSSPFWPAGQLMMARLPEMKSFWTSTTTRAELGRATFLIQSDQQNTNSSWELQRHRDWHLFIISHSHLAQLTTRRDIEYAEQLIHLRRLHSVISKMTIQ